ncbi:MAG: Hpt domain-containing protein [Clostridia bacterium]|nr:Hpt domain-containing protein [Clostridia bacterium]
MTVKEFYDMTGGGYETIFSLFRSDTTIMTFLKKFKNDTSFATLCDKMAAGDVEESFKAAHTLKGVVLNLRIEGLQEPVCTITEALRAKDMEEAKKLLPAVKQTYEKVWDALNQLLP